MLGDDEIEGDLRCAGIEGTGGGGYLGMLIRLRRLRRGNAGSSWALGYPCEGVGEAVGVQAGGTHIDSGRVFCGKLGGSGEERVRILENSRVYHSESDSSESEVEIYSEGCSGARLEVGRYDVVVLRFVTAKGFMETRRGLKGDANSSSEEEGVIGKQTERDSGLVDIEDDEMESVGDSDPVRLWLKENIEDDGVGIGG